MEPNGSRNMELYMLPHAVQNVVQYDEKEIHMYLTCERASHLFTIEVLMCVCVCVCTYIQLIAYQPMSPQQSITLLNCFVEFPWCKSP